MRTLPTLLIGIWVAAGTTTVTAAEQPGVTTIAVIAKRPHADAERPPPDSRVEIVTPMPTDMPEAEIDYHMPLIVAPAPTTSKARS